MKRLKRIGIGFGILLVLLLLFPLVSGNSHLYKAVPNTIFKGRLGPVINEAEIFDNRVLPGGEVQPWAKHKSYNTGSISDSLRAVMEGYGTVSFVVIKDDKLLYEEYWDGWDSDSLSNSYSMAKSIIGLLVGIAAEEELLNLDDPVSKYLPTFSEGMDADLTIKNLLQMASGIPYGENYKSPFSFMAKALYGSDLTDITLQYHCERQPGTQWDYAGGNTILLSMILTQVTGTTVSDYMQQKIWRHIGPEREALWSLDHEGGLEKSYCCFHSNGRDFARLGKLVMDNGKWNGKQLVPKWYIKEMLTPCMLPASRDKEVADHYGYQWWMGNYKGLHLDYARGMLGQYIVTIPENDMIVVRLGHRRSKERIDGHAADMFDYIDAALQLEAQLN